MAVHLRGKGIDLEKILKPSDARMRRTKVRRNGIICIARVMAALVWAGAAHWILQRSDCFVGRRIAIAFQCRSFALLVHPAGMLSVWWS
jgi:hypothetical protein